MKRILTLISLGASLAASAVVAAAMYTTSAEKGGTAPKIPAGSVTREKGLEAWNRVHAVVSHPRCANCHVGPDNIPMWTLVGEKKSRPHGMNIDAGASRMGAETLACSTCHMTSTAPNTVPHAPPHVGLPWQLAPVKMEWFGKTSHQI